MKNCLAWCSIAFSVSCSREMPCQLSQLLKLPFLGMGMRMESTHSLGTLLSSHILWTRSAIIPMNSSTLPPAFSFSGRMLELPGAFPFLNFPRAMATSADVGTVPRSASVSLCLTLADLGTVPRSASVSLCLTSASSAPSNWLLTFSTLVKCLLQCWYCSIGVLQGSPLSSQMATTLVELYLFFQTAYLLCTSTPSSPQNALLPPVPWLEPAILCFSETSSLHSWLL